MPRGLVASAQKVRALTFPLTRLVSLAKPGALSHEVSLVGVAWQAVVLQTKEGRNPSIHRAVCFRSRSAQSDFCVVAEYKRVAAFSTSLVGECSALIRAFSRAWEMHPVYGPEEACTWFSQSGCK